MSGLFDDVDDVDDVDDEDRTPQRGPRGGDYSICGGCMSVLIINEDLTLRAPTAEELEDAPAAIKKFMKAMSKISKGSRS
jgi:hypothetical protein